MVRASVDPVILLGTYQKAGVFLFTAGDPGLEEVSTAIGDANLLLGLTLLLRSRETLEIVSTIEGE